MSDKLTIERAESILRAYKAATGIDLLKPEINQKERMGAKLKEIREANSLLQSDIASRMGYKSTNFISNIEKGNQKPPLHKMKKFAAAYEVGGTFTTKALYKELIQHFYPNVWDVCREFVQEVS